MKAHYKVEIRWSDEDGVFLAHVPELEITTHGNTQVQAAKRAEEAVDLHLETLKDLDIEAPVPAADKDFRGQIPLRLGRARHEDLYIKAKKSGLSMNEYLLSLIDRDISEPTEYVVKTKAMKVEEGRAKIKAKSRGTRKQTSKR